MAEAAQGRMLEVMDPDILIYDEPFVGLDPISMGLIVRLVRRMNDALGITSIIVSHDAEEVATVDEVRTDRTDKTDKTVVQDNLVSKARTAVRD